METTNMKRRSMPDNEVKILEPILVTLNRNDSTARDIHIDKPEFKIGRARDNDEIILDLLISRKHCVIRYQGNGEWTIKDLSSSYTFVNDDVLELGSTRKIFVGDIIQFSTNSDYKYVFTLNLTEETNCKRQRIDKQLFYEVFAEQKTSVETQKSQRKELKDKLENKQKEQLELKEELNVLLKQWDMVHNDKEGLKNRIEKLKDKIATGNNQEKHLQSMYSELLKKFKNEKTRFEIRLSEEREKWQEALDLSKQEKKLVEIKMRKQMGKWREEQQAGWKSLMENIVMEEKYIQAQLLTEKIELEEKLKETEKALKDKEIKSESIQSKNAPGSNMLQEDSCIVLEVLDTSNLRIIDTIDLTKNNTDNVIVPIGAMDTVSNIMDEQLTCSVCSELFIKATTLNCMHTFCFHCIDTWNKKRKECPVCRASVKSMNRSLVLDNFIEKMLDKLSMHMKDRRAEIVEEREALEREENVHKEQEIE
uniref:E3 ubiquitin-protein ligase RNF8-like isoform X1 n=1 Tax=Vespula vulgaris TaxID=7454 RepID=UPI002137BB10|nr:E3 ubiquitin-protein ligase RNF8-like isoform X1 [Vespula vulgaris]XP_050852226.1 E3 ubiquitin-protein ligase RNF8-like isoform X1 [Vespula vulgaris]